MRFFYSLAIRLYSGSIALASFFGNKKARLWWRGRKRQWQKLHDESNEEWLWFHVSSLGEFEQGLPVIEKIKVNYPNYKILLTFFSPSGYELRKDFKLADLVAYLPSDTMQNAKKMLRSFNIKAAFFVKYDFWFNYMKALNDNDIPLYYISALLHKDHYFFKSYAFWFRRQLKNVKHFFVQNDDTAKLLKSIGIECVTIVGDTRFDRVFEVARQSQSFPEIENFIDGRKCIIAGSSWQPDEKLLLSFLKKMPDDYCMIIAPHDISDSHINQIKSQLEDYQLFTSINADKRCNVLIIDTIGLLKKIYKYARFAYVGGGFMKSIHNTQEALVYGCPVVIGPNYKKFVEAVDLVENGGMFSVNNQDELDDIFYKLIKDDVFYNKASGICQDYIQLSIGATEKIITYLDLNFFDVSKGD